MCFVVRKHPELLTQPQERDLMPDAPLQTGMFPRALRAGVGRLGGDGLALLLLLLI